MYSCVLSESVVLTHMDVLPHYIHLPMFHLLTHMHKKIFIYWSEGVTFNKLKHVKVMYKYHSLAA